MKTLKKITALVLLVCLISSFWVGHGNAAETDVSPETDSTVIEDMATDYITKYIETAYLYESNDLQSGTILEAVANTAETASMDADISAEAETQIIGEETQIFTGEEMATAASLCDNISFFEDTAEFYKYFRSSQGIERYNFTLASGICGTEIGEDYAYVHLYTEVSFQYEAGGETAVGGDNYIVKFAKVNGEWYIIEVISEDLVTNGMTKETFDYAEEVQKFDEAQATTAELVSESADMESISDGATAEINATTIGSRNYNKNNAIAYAYVYTTSTYSAATGNNSSFLNPNFFNYSSLGGNCQNFASQCVWAGFGGTNETTSINNYLFPMDKSGSYQWYGDKYGYKSPSWASCSHFYDYAVASNGTSSETGMKSTVTALSNAKNLSSLVSSLPGSVMHVYGSDTNYGHAIFIVSAASGTDVRYCGNSPMRKCYKVSDETFASKPVHIITPTSMREATSCLHTYGSSSTGTSCTCTKCGYSKLVVTGTQLGCIASGKTVTVSGSANYTCYRMAMGITTPGGTTTWLEVMNTKTISRSYTFSQKGLYTIKIAGRDISDSESGSKSITYTFTVRVY